MSSGPWRDLENNQWATPLGRAVGDPTTVTHLNRLTANQRVFSSSKLAWLPGNHAHCLEAWAESGGGFFFWKVWQVDEVLTIADQKNYGGAISAEWAENGFRNRAIGAHFWFVLCDAADIGKYLPGGSNDDEVFSLAGGEPYGLHGHEGYKVEFYTGPGGAGENDNKGVVSVGDGAGGTARFTFFARGSGDDAGELQMKFTTVGTMPDYAVVAGFVHAGHKISKHHY